LFLCLPDGVRSNPGSGDPGEGPGTGGGDGVGLNTNQLVLEPGASTELFLVLSIFDAAAKMWASSNDSIATVKDGIVTGVAAGTATIAVTIETGSMKVTLNCTVIVGSAQGGDDPIVPVTVVQIDTGALQTDGAGDLWIKEGDNAQLAVTVKPDNATDKGIQWVSSNTKIATVNANGKVTGIAGGQAVISATAVNGGKWDHFTITVKPKVTGVSLVPNTLGLTVGGKATLTATVSPANAADPTVTWTSSNTGVATVANGVVTGVAAGSATITATSKEDGSKTAVCVLSLKFGGDASFFSGTVGETTQSAIDMIRAAKQAASPVTVELSQGTETVSFTEDADIGTTGLVLTDADSPASVVIDGGGRTVQLDDGTGSVITVGAGVTLTLRNITLTGNTGNNAPLIRVNGGTLVLEDGVHITGNTSSNDGGGVYVNDGTFTMSGDAEIHHNTAERGGGVYVFSGGTFEMNGGEISNNTATSNGGGVYVYSGSGTFEMNGGEISSNTANASGGGVYDNGSFTMTNAKITKNTADSNGGGVSAYGSFTMTGSEISGNTAKWGGGVSMSGSSNPKFEMTGGTISGNTATGNAANDGGGGVAVYTGTFTMTGGTISNNETPNGAGAGIVIGDAKSGTVTMNSGTISGNTAGTNGGGVYVKIGTFTMQGDAISGNTATQGGGVYVGGDKAEFVLTGGVIYGSDENGNDTDSKPLKNTATGSDSGAAVYGEDGGKSNVDTTGGTVSKT
jgi:uncharacterized protein YjdB